MVCLLSASGLHPLKALANLYYRWMFEKYDGIRGFWNPMKKKFYSRYGNPISIPQQIVETMPTDLFLDGEIWYNINLISIN